MLFILFSYTIEQIHISQAGRDMTFVWVRAGCGNLLRTESAYQRLLVLALPDGWMEAVGCDFKTDLRVRLGWEHASRSQRDPLLGLQVRSGCLGEW